MATLPPFETVVEAHGATVWRVCAAVVGAADADDAWQETMIAALRAYPGLRVDSHVRGWLLTIARRKAIDAVRARGRRGVPSEAEDLESGRRTLAPPADAAAQTLVDPAEPTATELWALVATLPEAQRNAVAYHYLGGLPHSETATLLGRSPAAVRRAAADGVARLRRSLNLETLT